ncbi:MAG: hypothetical protein DRQ65_05840 [Gammaproteobacteria bacterium]|nr:MAG: hypothetical protein DRQ65_05840 [Gammaproteobacteria bacterium]HDY82177.1 hypothetical protein [Halieaceae bacterium]
MSRLDRRPAGLTPFSGRHYAIKISCCKYRIIFYILN